MVGKRGQLTLFIIAAVVIIAVVVGYFIFTNKSGDTYFDQPGVSDDVSDIKEYMDSCLEYVVEDSLALVSSQGGYFDAPLKIKDLENGSFSSYYSYEGVNYVPSLKVIESELGKAVDDIVGDCIDAAEFTSYDVRYSSIKTNVEIKDTEVEYVVDMPIVLEREGHTMVIEMKDRPIIQTSYLKGMYNVASYYMEDLMDDSEYCVNCLGSLAKANDVYIDVLDISSSESLSSAVIVYENSSGEYTYFVFLNKFSEGDFDDPLVLGGDLGYAA